MENTGFVRFAVALVLLCISSSFIWADTYLILTRDQFVTTLESIPLCGGKSFAEWKGEEHNVVIKTNVVMPSQSLPVNLDSVDRIKECINQNVSGRTFVLLVGDQKILPAFAPDQGTMQVWPRDFELVFDNPNTDIWLGRFPVQSPWELETVIKKTYSYMQKCNIGNIKNSLHVIAGKDVTAPQHDWALAWHSPFDAVTHNPAAFMDELKNYPGFYRRWIGHKPSVSSNIPIHQELNAIDTVAAALSDSSSKVFGTVFYSGHGSKEYWRGAKISDQPSFQNYLHADQVFALPDQGYYPLYLAFACLTTSYQDGFANYGGHSIGSSLVVGRGGGVAYMGYSSSISILDIGPYIGMATEYYANLQKVVNEQTGAIATVGGWARSHIMTGSGDTNFRLLGDPSLKFTGKKYDFYVDATAAAGGDGGLSEPFQTIPEAITAASDGDSILVFPGTYNAAVTIDKDVVLESNTPDDPSQTSIGAVITIPSQISYDIAIRGFACTAGINATWPNSWAGKIAISKCRISGGDIILDAQDPARIRAEIHDNYFDNCGIDAFAAAGNVYGNKFRKGTISGFSSFDIHNNLFDNRVDSDTEAGVPAIASNYAFNGLLRNNTIVVENSTAVGIFNPYKRIQSNLIFVKRRNASDANPYYCYEMSGLGNYNLLYLESSNVIDALAHELIQNGVYDDIASLQARGGEIDSPDSADPLFVDADGADNIAGNADDDFRLQQSSPCVGVGANSLTYGSTPVFDYTDGEVHKDFSGYNRIFDTIVDIGAIEYWPAEIASSTFSGVNMRNAMETLLDDDDGFFSVAALKAMYDLGDPDGVLSLSGPLSGESIGSAEGIQYCNNLRRLDMSDNQLENVDVQLIADNLFLLAELDLTNNSFNTITDISPLASLVGLQRLYIGENQISDISALSSLPNLKVLDVHGCLLTDISSLSELTTLEVLDVSDNGIADITALASLTNLKQVNIAGNDISDITPLILLAQTGALETVSLDGNPIPEDQIEILEDYVTVIKPSTNIDQFSLFGTEKVMLHPGVSVLAGDIGSNKEGDYGIHLVWGVAVPAGVNLKADQVKLGKDCVVDSDISCNDLNLHKKAALNGQQIAPLVLPVAGNLPEMRDITVGTENIFIANGQTATVSPGSYRLIHIGKNCAVTFEGGEYQARKLVVGKESTVSFEGPAIIGVTKGFRIGK
ncbi:C25 family cysteine peptidase, partial [Planctomycetota bacterium]